MHILVCIVFFFIPVMQDINCLISMVNGGQILQFIDESNKEYAPDVFNFNYNCYNKDFSCFDR